jgi:type II secretory pathway pseudopilin PulG
MKSSGFTLLELLVLIALGALLLALLAPLFLFIREKALATYCRSNLQQIGKALHQYLQDWDEAFPRGLYTPSPPASDGRRREVKTWKDALFPYLRSREVFLCLSNPVGWGRISDYWKSLGAYGFEEEGANLPGDSSGRFPVSYSANSSLFRVESYANSGAITLADLAETSDLIALGETRLGEVGGAGPYFGPWAGTERGLVHHHHKYINYLFLDGRVKPLKAIQTFLPRWLWGPPHPHSGSLRVSPNDKSSSFDRGESQLLHWIAPEYR